MNECEIQMKSAIEIDHYTGDFVPFSFRAEYEFFNVPLINRYKCCEPGPTVYRPYPFADVITKAALFPHGQYIVIAVAPAGVRTGDYHR